MRDDNFTNVPRQYRSILTAGKQLNFNMASDLHIGALLKTLVASKPASRILELGTGTGLATAWMADGLDKDSKLITVDNNESLMAVAKEHLKDERIEFVCAEGNDWIRQYDQGLFDLIFADAIPGKYEIFEETLELLKIGGFYIVDDMAKQPNWPTGHKDRVAEFIREIELRKDLVTAKMNWSTGVIISVKISADLRWGKINSK